MTTRLEELEKQRDVLMESIYAKYLEDLRKGICKVSFTKKDGADRVMRCTLDLSRVPQEHMPKTDGNLTEEDVVPKSVRVYDLEKEAWRSFRVDSVKVFEPIVYK